MTDLSPLERRYLEALDQSPGSRRVLSAARGRFSERLHGIGADAPSRWRVLAPLALAAGVVLVGAAWLRPAAPLSVSLRERPGQPVELVEADAAERVVDFSDGSEVRVRHASRVRVLGLSPDGAEVALERGAAHVSVVHREQTRWTFHAGPYRVHVVGTEFELRWQPDRGALEVEMTDGVVEVDGPGLRRQRVTAGDRLEALDAPPAEAPPAEVSPAPAPPRAKRAKEPASAPSGGSWRDLAHQGDVSGALAAAEQAGFSKLVRSLPASDALMLGDLARQGRQPARAAEAWSTLRERFRGTPAAVAAALRLGALAEEQREVGAAARWYGRATREAPNAVTAPGALGAWFKVLAKAGRASEARPLAAEYLRRFKNGPDAPDAREVLGD